MAVELLAAARVAQLRAQELTYPEVGATAGPPPPGYRTFSRTRRLAARQDFDRAAEAIMTWQVQARSGLRVAASSLEVELDAVVVLRLGIGPAAITIPCRVVRLIDELDRRGFAYGTLPGHPERGEEAFVVQRQADGSLDFTVSAFSRPGTLLTRVGGPIGTLAQRLMTGRYLRSLD